MATANAPANNSTGTSIQVKSNPTAMALKNTMLSPHFQASLKATLPKHVSADKIVRLVMGSFQTNPKLLECTPESILFSVMQSAALGLEPSGGVLGQGYLVPFYSSKDRRFLCQFIPGYRGLCKLARQSGEVQQIWAEVVYEKDQFTYSMGLSPDIKHVRNDKEADPGPMTHVYAVARFTDGTPQFIVMNRREVEAIKKSTKSKDKQGNIFGPWADHEPEMWKKTAIRRLCKQLPLSVEAQTLMQQTESNDGVSMLAAAFEALPGPGEDDQEPIDAEHSEASQEGETAGDESQTEEATAAADDDPLAGLADRVKGCKSEKAVLALDAEYRAKDLTDFQIIHLDDVIKEALDKFKK